MNTELIESIGKMLPTGNRLELPKDDHFANYAQVKKTLITAGGKYKRCGFEFGEDAAAVQARLVGGEAIDDKKKFQFFATPPELAQRLVDLAVIHPGMDVLEPSAGQGAISNIVEGLGANCTVVELMDQNIAALKRQGYYVLKGDFLTMSGLGPFDRIVANPPFTKNQDIYHIKHMFTLLKPGGKLVSMASLSWTFGSQKKQVAFREWLAAVGGIYTVVEAGAFKVSGTNISSVIVEIAK